MARGFGTTVGAAGTDRILTSLTTFNSVRSYSIWIYKRGGSDPRRLFNRDDTATLSEFMTGAAVGASLEYGVEASIVSGDWFKNGILEDDVWRNVVLTWDSSSLSNVPILYYAGVAQTWDTATAPQGTLVDVGTYCVGNRTTTSNRVWDGFLAEFAVWNRIISPAEAAALAAGAYPVNLSGGAPIYYVPICGLASPEPEVITGASATVTGTAFAAHPAGVKSACGKRLLT